MAITNFHEKTKVIPKRLAIKQIAQVNKQANPKEKIKVKNINVISITIADVIYLSPLYFLISSIISSNKIGLLSCASNST